MEPVCLECGHIGPDLHFLGDPEEQQAAEMKEIEKINTYRKAHDRRQAEVLKNTPIAVEEEPFRLDAE